MLALETTYYSPEKIIINHHHDNKIKNIRTEIKTPSKHLELKYLPLGIVEINLWKESYMQWQKNDPEGSLSSYVYKPYK